MFRIFLNWLTSPPAQTYPEYDEDYYHYLQQPRRHNRHYNPQRSPGMFRNMFYLLASVLLILVIAQLL